MLFSSLRSTIGCACLLGGLAIAAGPTLIGTLPVDAASAPFSAVLVAFLGLAIGLVLRQLVLRRLDRVLKEQKAENLRFDTAINNMTQGLCFFDGQRRLIVCNNRYAELYKLSRDMVRRGTTLAEIVDHRFAAGSFPDMSRDDYLKWRESIAVADKASDTVSTLKDGRTIAIHHEPMPDGGWVATHADITEQCRTQAQIERMLRHDALTGLPNRLLFREHLNEALQRNRIAGHSLAVLCIDLDRFKEVNDTLGHPVGDQLLRAAAQRLNECVGQNDLVARLGGDEFAIVQTKATQPIEARALADRLVRVMAAPFRLEGHQVVVGVSVGVAVVAGDTVGDPDELLKEADLAMYEAKAGGRGKYSVFTPEMGAHVQGRRWLENDLRAAVDRGEFELFFQPIVGLADHRVRAFEALLRWHHPSRGLLMPDQFIALAEETGLIEAIGAWVLKDACSRAAQWPSRVGIAVNLSPVQLRSGNLIAVVQAALQASGLSPTRLELEITESVPLAGNSHNLAMLHELRALGVRISLDDFGVGYSSLGYLRTFPFSKIKIDRSFVRDVAGNRDAAAIVRAVTTLGEDLGMAITAEGVETDEQWRLVRELGCEEAQGYFISRPRPAGEVDAILRIDSRLAVVRASVPC